jgi:hypothetical protein
MSEQKRALQADEGEQLAAFRRAVTERNGNLAAFDTAYFEISPVIDGYDKARLRGYLASQQKAILLLGVPIAIANLIATVMANGKSVSIAWENERPSGRDLAGDFFGVFFYPN